MQPETWLMRTTTPSRAVRNVLSKSRAAASRRGPALYAYVRLGSSPCVRGSCGLMLHAPCLH
eukprot:1575083-Prymnesium_polylepis.1